MEAYCVGPVADQLILVDLATDACDAALCVCASGDGRHALPVLGMHILHAHAWQPRKYCTAKTGGRGQATCTASCHEGVLPPIMLRCCCGWVGGKVVVGVAGGGALAHGYATC